LEKRIVILGAGESGTGSAVLAKLKGFDVFVSDKAAIATQYKQLLDEYKIAWEEETHTSELILNAAEVIKSPGIPDKAPIVLQIKEKHIPIISEIEFAMRYTTAKTVGITGSNGKTTTTLLTYHIFKNAGYNVGLGGNIGKSFALQVALENFDWYILELSSFQLDGMPEHSPDISILLNITPDHLDRYDYKFENYVDSKFGIVRNPSADKYLIYCADDPILVAEVIKRMSNFNGLQLLPFSVKNAENAVANFHDQTIEIADKQEPFSIDYTTMLLTGTHNVYNTMAATLAARLGQIRKDIIRESLTNFKSVEHRLEPVLQIKNVQYINDSKATNVNSVWYALESTKPGIVWIAGGVDKGNDYSEIMDLVKAKVRVLICLGVDNSKLKTSFEGKVQLFEAGSMKEAVKIAYAEAKKEETVLLSPACASFDLFKNYEDRGRQFKEEVRKL